MDNKTMKLTSPAFAHEGQIPARHTCDDGELSPPLKITDRPEDTVTLALIVEDPDAPGGTFDHWLVWNIPPTDTIGEGGRPGISGRNSAGKTGYHSPCPPDGEHRYYFHVFALNRTLDLSPDTTKEELQEAMDGHILAEATLMGRYRRTQSA